MFRMDKYGNYSKIIPVIWSTVEPCFTFTFNLFCVYHFSELKIRKDDAFLLRFLRAKKFDYDRAYNLIVRHFEMKADEKNKQLFTNLRPAAVKHVLDAGVTGVLPHRDKLGRRVIVFRPGTFIIIAHTLLILL